MQHVSWVIPLPKTSDRHELEEGFFSLCCQFLNLCAGVGCTCVTGQAGDLSCSEAIAGPLFDVRTSQGPTWVLTSVSLPKSLCVDLFYDGPTVAAEFQALNYELAIRKVPVYVSGQSEV